MREPIPLARPNITPLEIEAVTAVLRTPNLSLGPELPAFEADFAAFCGTRHAVAVSSGTAALHLLVHARGIGPGDEVITTPFSFVASANCVLMERAKPVFADIDPATWNIEPARIAAAITPRTRAIIAVDVFGQPADMDAIRELARKHGLFLIEDSCEALGSAFKGRPAGSLGDAGVFGFYPNKQLTTGEGGMIVTDDNALADRCRSLRNQGRDASNGWLAHARLGYNFRLSDINCALGRAQLARIKEIIETRDRVHSWYRLRLETEPRLVMQAVRPDVRVSWFVFVVRLADSYTSADRDRILNALRTRGIGCGNYFVPIHLQPFYAESHGFRPGDFPECERVAARTIALPFHHELDEGVVDYICGTLRDLL